MIGEQILGRTRIAHPADWGLWLALQISCQFVLKVVLVIWYGMDNSEKDWQGISKAVRELYQSRGCGRERSGKPIYMRCFIFQAAESSTGQQGKIWYNWEFLLTLDVPLGSRGFLPSRSAYVALHKNPPLPPAHTNFILNCINSHIFPTTVIVVDSKKILVNFNTSHYTATYRIFLILYSTVLVVNHISTSWENSQ